jgi:ATP-dependent helicase/nuclease subunit A
MSAPRPTEAQAAAADPAVSAWVGANAGSGKTGVLTQRVARLLLAGARPERVLCLTYTKAAAVEMQRRLFGMLGDWAMADDATLGARLAALSRADAPETGAGRLREARRLFAAALETPGGLKIQTIHAFCDAVLRRFPLEAGVSPRFEVLDDRAKALMLAEIRAEMGQDAETGRDTAFDAAAARLGEGGLESLVGAVLARRERLSVQVPEAALRAAFGEAAPGDAEAACRAALDRVDWDALTPAAAAMGRLGGKRDLAFAEAAGEAVGLAAREPVRAVDLLLGVLLTKKGTPASRNGFPTKAALAAHPAADAAIDAALAWAAETREALAAAEVAARARDLHRFGASLIRRYEARKAALGLLDFDDLVSRMRRLLGEADLRQWLLWKLDRGIDHVLVDEAQDTAPAQWEVIRAITEEFFAGETARGPERTLFVVGDEKQSIYSFQGAEPRAFGAERARAAERIAAAGSRLETPALETSFRSAPGILAFVDRVFADDPRALSLSGDRIRHAAARARDAARIDLWPLREPEAREADGDWEEPAEEEPPEKVRAALARDLAAEIARMVREDRRPARGGAPGARVRPGDILVLVRRRDILVQELIRRLKALGVPVAGADRLHLAAGLAVQDLLALMRCALDPANDLSLAAVLRSPLADVDEEALFALAHGRAGTLRSALEAAAERHPREAAMLEDLSRRADFLRPYEFLERVLIGHDGRRRLVARLGAEAEDLIDELLEQALAYEARAVPTLAGFLAWIEAGEIEVKREMEQGADAVRVMTVHGAKGLEAPVVILPDTVQRRGGGGRQLVLPAPGRDDLALWMPPKTGDDPVAARARAEHERREEEERQRLLYVALTRAEDWLILCGAGSRTDAEKDWYGQLERAVEATGAREVALPGGQAIRRLEDAPVAPVSPAGADRRSPETAGEPAPAWLGTAAAAEPRPVRRAPSDLVAHAAGPGGAGRGQEAALAHGRAVHLLLERLAELPAEARPALAERLLTAEEPALDAPGRAAARAEAEAVLAAPFAGQVFGPGSLAEAGLALRLPALSEAAMIGRIDRLVVAPDRVRVIDFKTDRAPPARAEDAPAGYLAQIAAYAEALGSVFPGREIEAALLWTAVPRLVALPQGLLAEALAAAREASPEPLDSGGAAT